MTGFNSNVLVLGESNVGKSVYATQLYGRLRAGQSSRLRLNGAPASISMLEDGMNALNRGDMPQHNPAGDYQVMDIPTRLDEEKARLRWPDFAGEQITQIVSSRVIPKLWAENINQSDAWLLMLRLGAVADPVDAVQRPAHRGRRTSNSAASVTFPVSNLPKPWNANAQYVELLQMMLYGKRLSARQMVEKTPLLVAVSCWDELLTNEAPPVALQNCLQMFYEYLSSTWHPDAWRVFGISALGMPPTNSDLSAKLRDEGPEQQGYVIRPDGERSLDLAEPIVWLMEYVDS